MAIGVAVSELRTPQKWLSIVFNRVGITKVDWIGSLGYLIIFKFGLFWPFQVFPGMEIGQTSGLGMFPQEIP